MNLLEACRRPWGRRYQVLLALNVFWKERAALGVALLGALLDLKLLGTCGRPWGRCCQVFLAINVFWKERAAPGLALLGALWI